MKVAWSEDSAKDLSDIAEHIALDNPYAAERLDALFVSAARRLADFPERGRMGRLPGTREIPPHRHYRMIYSMSGDTVWIETLVHTAREWPPAGNDS